MAQMAQALTRRPFEMQQRAMAMRQCSMGGVGGGMGGASGMGAGAAQGVWSGKRSCINMDDWMAGWDGQRGERPVGGSQGSIVRKDGTQVRPPTHYKLRV